MEDIQEIENLINTFYKIISGEKSQKRDWELFFNLFIRNAQVLPIKSDVKKSQPILYNIETYKNYLEKFLLENNFYEAGYNYNIKIYNDIASAYSEYKTIKCAWKSGINLINFIKINNEWKISFMQWQDK